jgi:hypothetical protein
LGAWSGGKEQHELELEVSTKKRKFLMDSTNAMRFWMDSTKRLSVEVEPVHCD